MDEETIMKFDLASITKSVAETDRRRAAVEEKLTQAQSVVESLNAESKSLEASVLELKRDLEATTKAKEEEITALSRTTEERKRAIGELKLLSAAADELRSDSERKSAAIGAHLNEARGQLAALESSALKARSDAGSLDETVSRLRTTIAEARRQSDVLELQLSGVGDTMRSTVAISDEIERRVNETRAALEIAVSRKQETDEMCAALATITAALRGRTADATASMRAMDELMTEEDRQTSVLASRLADVAKLVGQTETQSSTPPPPKTSTNGSPSAIEANRFANAQRAIALLVHERLLSQDEADRIAAVLRSGDGERVLREVWALTTGGPMQCAHRLIFAEVLLAMGDVKASVVYYEQAATTKNAPPVIRYLAALAYLRMDLFERATHATQVLARDRGGRLLSRIVEALRMEQSGRGDEAASALSEAAGFRGFPKWEYDEARVQLGALYERRNDIDAAVACYDNVSTTYAPYHDVVDRIRALVKQPSKV